MTRWIGLTGPMGAGKDYAFNTMLTMGAHVMRMSFADGLRIEIQQTLGLEHPIQKPYTELERKLQQWWGTDYRRAEDPDYWVRLAEHRAEVLEAETGLTPVFTDVRFPNEADMITRHGGLLVQVLAGKKIREVRLGMEPPQHESETALAGYLWPTDTYALHSVGDGDMYQRAIVMLLKAAGI